MSRLLREMRETMTKLDEINQTHLSDLKAMFGENAKVVLAYSEESPNYTVQGVPVSLDEWHEIMLEALAESGGYNNFDVGSIYKLLTTIPGSNIAKFQPGREGSVVLYITTYGDEELAQEMYQSLKDVNLWLKANEIDMVSDMQGTPAKDVIRVWWD